MKIMKEIVESEIPAGLESLLNQKVLLFCLNYIYEGTLSGVNDTFVQLKEAQIVYETGGFKTKSYSNLERLPGDVWYVQRAAVESFGPGK